MIIQSDYFSYHINVTLLPITSTLVDAPLLRVDVYPTIENGIQKPSQIMIDKVMTIRRDKIGPTFGRVEKKIMTEVERKLLVFLGIA